MFISFYETDHDLVLFLHEEETPTRALQVEDARTLLHLLEESDHTHPTLLAGDAATPEATAGADPGVHYLE